MNARKNELKKKLFFRTPKKEIDENLPILFDDQSIGIQFEIEMFHRKEKFHNKNVSFDNSYDFERDLL